MIKVIFHRPFNLKVEFLYVSNIDHFYKKQKERKKNSGRDEMELDTGQTYVPKCN